MAEPILSTSSLKGTIAALERRCLINGALVAAASQESFPVIHPATLEVIGEAASAGRVDVDLAVSAASAATGPWAARSARERGALVTQAAKLLLDHSEELARITTLETGKAIRPESRVEVAAAADIYQFFGGLGSELKGEALSFKPTTFAVTVREPLGVVAAIIPWNVPLLLMALKVAPALVAGNTVVLKSAEQAPFATLRAAQLMNQVLPAGVLNVLSGLGPDCGEPLVTHPKIGKVTFTGSVETGKRVYSRAAERIIPVTLELGGKSPMIVFSDVDLDRAVQGAIVGMRFTRQGQSCTAASRIYVHSNIFNRFVARLKERLDALVIGDPFDDKTDIGAIISREQYDKVHHYIQVGESTPGAQAHRCSKLPIDARFKDGLFMQPVFFTGLGSDSPLVCEEIFGPVTVLTPWDDVEKVISLANATEFGLAATVWTNDIAAAMKTMTKLKAGYVQCNQNLVVQAGLPFGGFKSSGIGKEGTLEAMLDHYTQRKTIMVNME